MLCEGRSVMSSRIKCTCACGSLEQCTMCRDVVSQAGVLCEMTTRADETQTPPPKPKERRQPSPAAWWGTWSSMSSQPLADTATLTPRHSPRGLLSISPSIA